MLFTDNNPVTSNILDKGGKRPLLRFKRYQYIIGGICIMVTCVVGVMWIVDNRVPQQLGARRCAINQELEELDEPSEVSLSVRADQDIERMQALATQSEESIDNLLAHRDSEEEAALQAPAYTNTDILALTGEEFELECQRRINACSLARFKRENRSGFVAASDAYSSEEEPTKTTVVKFADPLVDSNGEPTTRRILPHEKQLFPLDSQTTWHRTHGAIQNRIEWAWHNDENAKVWEASINEAHQIWAADTRREKGAPKASGAVMFNTKSLMPVPEHLYKLKLSLSHIDSIQIPNHFYTKAALSPESISKMPLAKVKEWQKSIARSVPAIQRIIFSHEEQPAGHMEAREALCIDLIKINILLMLGAAPVTRSIRK